MAILSIQSHVSYGYVGNRAATFPLQRLGHEVWAVNTVEFSNHTGYGSWQGTVFTDQMVKNLVLGIEERGVLCKCEALLSGYLGSAEIGEVVLDALSRIKRSAPKAIYCCDPVMGDYDTGFFVRKGIPEILKDKIISQADIVTPNQFELEALTGIEIHSVDDARRAADILHQKGPGVVLITSFRSKETAMHHIDMLASDKSGLYRVRTPELAFTKRPNGAGDLTTALFLSRYLQNRDAARALELSSASVFAVLERSLAEASPELLLIQTQDELVQPTRRFIAERL
ncbi:pyridoxal kinase [Treponema sp.]